LSNSPLLKKGTLAASTAAGRAKHAGQVSN
jgi:hypothetical protein